MTTSVLFNILGIDSSVVGGVCALWKYPQIQINKFSLMIMEMIRELELTQTHLYFILLFICLYYLCWSCAQLPNRNVVTAVSTVSIALCGDDNDDS